MSASSVRALVNPPGQDLFGSSRYRIAVAGLLLLGLASFGGASRIDEPAQLAARLAAIGAIALNLLPLDFAPLRASRRMALFALACAALPLVQLIPLPAPGWDRLPGHSTYAAIARASQTVGWRPLSLTPDLTINALLALLVPAASAIALLYLDGNGRKAFAAGFVLIAFASAMLGLAQLGIGDDQLRLYRHTSENAPVGLFANRNHQAALLACAFPLAAAVIPPRAGAHTRLVMLGFLALAALVVTAVLLFTGSRMGVVLWLGGVAGAAWTFHARGLLRLPADSTARAAWALGLAAVAGTILAAVLFDGELIRRLRHADMAADTRWLALPALLETARAFFPAGSGFGSFASVYPRFEPDGLLSTIYLNQAHDEPLQLAIEGGLPALVLLLLFAWWWGRTAARLVFPGKQAARRGLPRAALVVTALLMLSSLFDYPLRTPLLAALFAACCVEMALGARRKEDVTSNRVRPVGTGEIRRPA
jgi:hypothetical protein